MGTVAEWTTLEATGLNTVDAALVKPNEGVQLSNERLKLGPDPTFLNLTINEYIKMRSRAVNIESQRGTVNGVVDSVHNDLLFDCGGRAFRSQTLRHTRSR